jgi:protoheme IX farnesyltransferase
VSRTPRLTTLLAGATVGVYLLVVVGATAALTEAVAACRSWPLCSGPLTDPQVALATGHRLVAAVVGVLVALAGVAAWRGWGVDPDDGSEVRAPGGVSRRVRAAVALALVLYPAQVAVGAVVAVTGAPLAASGLHLAVGTAIFGALALALAWQLERETATDDARHDHTPEPAPAPEPTADREPAPEPTGLARAGAVLRAYVSLTKPRLMWLLCLVAAAGMALAAGSSGEPLTVRTVLYTLGGGVLAIGASGTFNHVLERDADARMDRTADRPLASHEVPVRNAVGFGLLLAAASLAAFLQVNGLVAVLGLTAILFYSVVYTLVLKPNTVQNTVIGGAAGALPALIGWVAVAGEFGLPGVVLAGVVFLWTPAHFYNLAMAYREDYERGGFPMLPVVRGETVTRKHVLYYLTATLLAAGALTALAGLGWLYALATVALGGVFLWAVVRLHRERTRGAALRAFHASNAYLGTLLVAVLLDTLAI